MGSIERQRFTRRHFLSLLPGTLALIALGLPSRTRFDFDQIKEIASANLHIIDYRDFGSDHTQLVIGELHYHPRVQRDLLAALVALHSSLGFTLIGKEGRQNQFEDKQFLKDIDLPQVLEDDSYMADLISQKVNATMLFAATHQDVLAQVVEDPVIDALSFEYDQRYRSLFEARQEAGAAGLSPLDERRFQYYLSLQKEVTLELRSRRWVENLYDHQQTLDVGFAVLVGGASHTPWQEVLEPYSVIGRLNELRINYLIGLPNSAWEILEKSKDTRDPFDFYTPWDELEVVAK